MTPEQLDALEDRLAGLQVAACNCDTKTPEPDAHGICCTYRGLVEGLIAIKELREEISADHYWELQAGAAMNRAEAAEKERDEWRRIAGAGIDNPVAYNAAIEEAARVALEQRCERDNPWDRACIVIANAIRGRKR